MREILFLLFFLIVLSYEWKRVGLIIYYFFQRFISLLLFISFMFFFEKIIFLLLIAKLGLFPFFYWVVVVRVKINYLGNIFVLRLQKLRIFWLSWLLVSIDISLLILFVYSRLFFVVFNLLLVSDLWLILIYSSIANTRLLVFSIYGAYMFAVVSMYLRMIFFIIYLLKTSVNYNETLLIVLIFLVVPPFFLFFIKIFIVIRLEYSLKLVFFTFLFDVLILFYYFSLIFIKFIITERGVLIYRINFIILLLIFLFRNCVTLTIFYKS